MKVGDLQLGAWSVATVVAALSLLSARAEAQFGYGLGYGFNFNYQPPEVGFINAKSLLNASQATMGPVQNNAYANNPNSYFNRLNDVSPYEKMDVGTRRSTEAMIGRYSDGPPPSSNPPASPGREALNRPAPLLPLASFFDRYQKLDWPAGAPTYGTLGTSRAASDLACLAVLNEYNLNGLALLGTVTDARSKLIEYGRPALEYLRNNTTPRVTDSFHLFLLSLYESLAQAATIPKRVAPAGDFSTPTGPAHR